MRGEPNAGLLAGARFLGPAITEPRYTLLHLGPYPGMREGGTGSIVGELYEVDDELLASLDDFEGHPELYRRARIRLRDGEQAEGYLLASDDTHDGIASGDWRRR